MMTIMVVKLNVDNGNRILLNLLIREIQRLGYGYKILRRPRKAYSKESFDGLLEIKSCDGFDKDFLKLFNHTEASGKFLIVSPNKNPRLFSFLNGQVIEEHIPKKKLYEIKDECLYYGENIKFDFSKEALFLESKYYPKVIEILSKYEFIQLESCQHLAYCKGWFFLSREKAEAFIKDLENIMACLSQHNLNVNMNLLAYDGQLDVYFSSVDDLTQNVS